VERRSAFGVGCRLGGARLLVRKSEDEQSDEELQAQIAEQVRRLGGRMIYLGLGLIVSVLLWMPFFDDGPRHRYWTSFDRIFAVLSLIFFLPPIKPVSTTKTPAMANRSAGVSASFARRYSILRIGRFVARDTY